MFTGIIEAVGSVASLQPSGQDMRLRIRSGALDLSDVQLGDSIAVNGVCLTVIDLPGDGFWADVSSESLRHTLLGRLKSGSRVNLEKALTPTTRLGGHLVSGHVDGIGEVVERRNDGRSIYFRIKAPHELARYIAHKGSITINGVSLTVNAVEGHEFSLNIVPHTLQETTLDQLQPAVQVNLEVDLLARYLERLLLGDKAADPSSSTDSSGLTLGLLAQSGFIK